jgi:hypothetical protein
MSLMFATGSPFTRVTSASFPVAIEPRSPSSFIMRAALSVAFCRTLYAGMPAWTSSSSSRCRANPARESVPSSIENSGAIEQASQFHHLGERPAVCLVHSFGRCKARGEQAAANLRRQAACDGLETARNLASPIEILVFEDAQGKIELGVVVLKQLDERQNLGRAEVEIG